MSDAQHDEHEPLIKTPKQLVIAVIAAFAVPILVIILLANYVGLGVKEGAGSSGMSEEAVNDRIKPVAQLELKDLNAPRVYKTGEQLYKEVCATCHAAGVAGAPKFGDAASWASRLPQGLDGLAKVALAGKGGMPARGGTSPDDVSDYEIQRAIVYMANSGGGKLQEPAAPASASAPQAAAEVAPATPAAAAPAPAAAAPAAAAAPQAAAGDIGKKVYDSTCQMCHAAGVAGAPKFGDKAAWAPRIAEGKAKMYDIALHGKGAMPPKGTYAGSDDDVKAAVDYMAAAAK
ncbi:c-type cytochrome [Ralstonia solanacearum]|uniref:c-type cytochrome n=2 Tax=Ralstonia solanacearum TaxID=305 RepID=UPI00044EEB97|nr:c-type cytochrome [Ralstonia solanacearum]EUJ16188.1 cytochrome C [Ralstonia solanacearum P673]MCL9846154.1 c-type cytochrome [Ralstonia solanacearum]MCL9854361.1 c-type cytochrome [Ralstonia solanacearum]MCL9860341.1 c-type cytochrome [Ralstonia solanacearum]MCL9865572.1 c-type cytochrome [Ralstonia solanacearum]